MSADPEWHPYDLTDDHTVVGDVLVSEELDPDSPKLPSRRILVYLPPSYREGDDFNETDGDDAYPVLYMHDGQNLFDERTSNAGEWRVDETMQALAEEALEAIVVAVPHGLDNRHNEYTPHPSEEFGGGDADAYLDFLASELKPVLDDEFRTRTDRDATGLMGSSLGGLVSLYGYFEYPEMFGFAGVMSPAFWWNREIFDYVESQSHVSGKLYVDVGGNERPDDPERTREYVEDAERMVELLRSKGYDEDELRFVVDDEAIHHEDAWADRLPDAVRFLLG
ncbi:alpha/beta hydrolase [Haloprofundus marisrubri]|uniref:Alpha/beta hydrolase n=1 Tax=Haloprofundus marisrubri TaxID=1514971 RepID=A0A0W1RC08_9EURY|nr:alpha/beta hydrolase-fold protein [Haloprofundus marisrubri]KTG10933.1 alpha/beta hydrolase [Haloprofundus marisrubri]